jgi:hypothetical protein
MMAADDSGCDCGKRAAMDGFVLAKTGGGARGELVRGPPKRGYKDAEPAVAGRRALSTPSS